VTDTNSGATSATDSSTTNGFGATQTTNNDVVTTTSDQGLQTTQTGLTLNQITTTSTPPNQPTTSPTPDGGVNVTIGDSGSTSLLTAATQTAGSSSTLDPSVTDAIAQANGTASIAQTDAVTTSSQLGNDTDSLNQIPVTTASSSSTAWLPTALITATGTTSDPSPQATGSDQSSAAQATDAANTPTIITPANGIPETPANSTLVRIGFLQSLNYPFVVQNSVTVAQIFQVLPIAGAYALNVGNSDVIVRSLEPYAVSDYTATSALVFIPNDEVNSLELQLLATNSRLYSQNNPTAQQLVDLIDPTIPLLANSPSSSTTDSNGASASGAAGASDQGAIGGSLDNGQSQETSTSSGKQAAIGIGAAAAAIAYAALMFLGARRFRKQSTQAQLDRHHHSRVSSITGERPISPPFAQSFRSSGSSGGRGVRGQNISAPLMTENTLLL
jgi:hypothetical protein